MRGVGGGAPPRDPRGHQANFAHFFRKMLLVGEGGDGEVEGGREKLEGRRE